ncbi:glycosyltransferase family 4 protein [Thiocapsa bogorovii]|uniref:glycosyltransferase family 4 protein n=1 Tax=Thiocapsa bogorovii TaxID=521689 RepID=UPI001E437EC2|nr:glycosyltransferase family 4 protein [Thiocapsa bogorovii]UHD16248.1 glycosyltransferase family 4 protein [Thiocapsa bogorovii]
MQVAITYYQLLDRDGNEQLIGGIESYLLNLARLCNEIGYKPVLFQSSNAPFRRRVEGLDVVGVPAGNSSIESQKNKLFNEATAQMRGKETIFIFGADHCSVRTGDPKAIAIQHGVSWDLPSKYFTGSRLLKNGPGAVFKKLQKLARAKRYFENCRSRVCVDYNFLNWYRTYSAEELRGNVWVIPNATHVANPGQIAERQKPPNSALRILFARRFMPYRGTTLMAEAAQDILARNPNLTFTFAGEGGEEERLRARFAGDRRVSFIKYQPHEAVSVHLQHDIAVIPSVASEGTSFAVAEAMGAGCAVIATPVGGISNMIIDGYNGVLVLPDTRSLIAGFETLIADSEFRYQIAKRAYETAVSAFNVHTWQRRWKAVLEQVAKE